MSKSGFSTLNRWLGRKNKDKSIANGNLSKSSTNLSISSTNINETSQLEYNRITPLPAATTNAPFEQTFRITVLLPKDQLYVTRLGARVPLSKLMELVCDNKLLDPEKYEFRNPVDTSQVYSCDLTIGAVGLSEIRLCHKSESYDNFNSDEIIKLRRTSLIRESLSSSEFSSHNSKRTTKTTSPYSSTNSLNSMDSSGLTYSRIQKLPTTAQPKMSAPPRKKRAAPRPPSQIAIPEKSPLIMENDQDQERLNRTQLSPLTTKDFSVSTPNLTSSTLLHSDINGNNCNGHMEDCNGSSGNGSLTSNGYNEDTVLYAQVQKKNSLNLHTDIKLKTTDDIDNSKLPEPSPRKRIVPIKKKTAAPLAPLSRSSMCQEDAESVVSVNMSISTPTTPVGTTNSMKKFVKKQDQPPKTLEKCETKDVDVPKPVPRITTTTLLNATDIENDLKNFESDSETSKAKPNISKVLLNRTPTPEPRSLSCEPPENEASFETHLEHYKQQKQEDDCVSKQADSGIGEPVPSPIPDSLPSEVSALDVKSNFESSSDDDDMVKVYNFKLGKTVVKCVNDTKTLEELNVVNNVPEETDRKMGTSLTVTQVPESNTVSETSSWNFAIPISPPPNFADNKFKENLETESKSDTPITPKITERPVLNFDDLRHEQEQQEDKKHHRKEKSEEKLAQTASTPLDDIMNELSAIIQEKGLDTLIKKSEDQQEIESAKPNTLTNFSINSIAQTTVTKPKEVLNDTNTIPNTETLINEEKTVIPPESKLNTSDAHGSTATLKTSSSLNSPSASPDEEKLYRKRSSVTSLKQRRSVTRSDSFHTTAVNSENARLSKRTSSQSSLDQMAGHLNRRLSSSELSIGESPSLQSLEVMKTILNSHKKNFAKSSNNEDKPIEVNARRPSDELKFASLELKTSNSLEQREAQTDLREKQRHEEPTAATNQEKDKVKPEPKDEKPKELPKVYRYSGPPSINFSTWNDRPKVQVAIKNEGDYIFGGKNSGNIKNYRMSTPATTMEPPPVAPKPATIQRMGIPDKEYKTPVVVKPLQDVIIDKVPRTEHNKFPDTLSNKPQMNGGIKSVGHIHRYSMIDNSSNSAFSCHSQRPTVEMVLRPQTQTIVNTASLPRPNKQRYSTPVTLPGPQILRSSSIKQQQKPTNPSHTPTDDTQQAPFGQNTLRRTGLKEKILAKEEQEKQKVINLPTATPSSSIQKPVPNGDLRSFNQKFNTPTIQNSLTSAKLHLNLRKSTSIITTIDTGSKEKTTFTTFSPASPNQILKPKPPTPTTAPVLVSHATFSTTPAAPPPPALTPAAKSIQLRHVTALRTPTPSEDPRDELLAAIRNFSREELKKA